MFATVEYAMFQLLLVALLYIRCVLGNTEKAIFLAPSSLHVPVEHPTLEDLQLEALSPQHWSLRTHIEAEFPTDSSKYGKSSWYLLHSLQEGQRHEIRICWAATVNPIIFCCKLLLIESSNPHPSVSKPMTYLLSLRLPN